jgi:hypothetical protein
VTGVMLLVAHGLPYKPYRYKPRRGSTGPAGPGIMACLQHLLDKQVPMNPRGLISAVKCGDVNITRFLHMKAGLPLWKRACEIDSEQRFIRSAGVVKKLERCVEPNTIVIPGRREERSTKEETGLGSTSVQPKEKTKRGGTPVPPKDCAQILNALRYTWYNGVPVTPTVEAMFAAARAATRAVLLCFHVAPRLCRRNASPRDRAVWGAMAGVPRELIEILLVHADLEIPESLGKALPTHRSVRVLTKGPWTWWDKGVKEYAISKHVSALPRISRPVRRARGRGPCGVP